MVGHFVASFISGIAVLVEFMVYYIGIINDFLAHLMFAAGLRDPRYQLYLYFTVFTVLAVLALRYIGGFIGWFILILLVLVLLQRLVPRTSLPPGTFNTPIQTVL